MTPADPPPVTVLLATYNGRAFLAEQLDSILGQLDVTVRVVVSDDTSTDGTWEYLQERAAGEPRLTLLPQVRSRGAAANFYRLLADVETEDPVAFADQDDIWHLDKLASQVAVLEAGADGVSSDVTAFDAAGARMLIRKSYPQRTFDYLCESPGPGCSQLLSRRLADLVRAQLAGDGPAAAMDSHDWLVYGVCRSAGWRWVIQNRPTLEYRQHDANAVGANRGLAAMRVRLELIRQDWHRREAVKMATVASGVAGTLSPRSAAELAEVAPLLSDRTFRARLRLAGRANQLRRRPRDRVLICGLILLGFW